MTIDSLMPEAKKQVSILIAEDIDVIRKTIQKYLHEFGFTQKDLLKIIKFSDECYFLNNSNDIKKSIEKGLKKL